MLEIKTRKNGMVIVFELSGTFDIDSANFIEKIGQAISDGYRDFLCSLEGVIVVDYSGLSALAIAYKNVLNHKCRMRFFGVPMHVRKLFNLVCMDKIFEIYPDEKQAIKSFEDESRISQILKKKLRRRFKRLHLDMQVQLKSKTEEQFYQGKVLNLSGVGLLVFSEKIYPIGDILDIKMSLAPVSELLTFSAKVVWLVQKEIQPQLYPAMGLEFYNPDPVVQDKILEYVDRNLPLDSEIN